MTPPEFIRPKETQILPCEGSTLHRNGGTGWVCKENIPLPESHITQSILNSGWTSFTVLAQQGKVT